MAQVIALVVPTFGRLLTILQEERQTLRALQDRYTRLGLLLAAGEHRFVARSIDEISAIEDDLGTLELARGAICDTLLPSPEGSMEDAIALAPDGLIEPLLVLGSDLQTLSGAVARERERCRAAARRRADLTATALSRITTWGLGPPDGPAA